MARKALLVGTQTYRDGFKPLKSASHDIEALAGLLRHPDVGGFEPENVQVLLDRTSSDLATQIETWYLQHGRDDFALLFIAGHGVKDADRKLHFAATNTQKVGEGLITTTAVAASSLSNWMQKSKSKRQIVILNCCFSGAFGDLVPMDEGAIDVEEVLGAEGRVVMTSTTSMDYAFERQNGELSVYGHYLVEGLRTGAAGIQGNDEITVGELHQYVSRKVQEEAPAMVPKLFAKGEGHRLRIAKVAIGDPEVTYRKKVEKIIQEDGDAIDEVFSRPILEELGTKLQLNPIAIAVIENEVLEPIRQRNAKRQKYLEFFQRAVQQRYPFGERELKRIAEYRKMLGLGDEEYISLEQSVVRLRTQIQSELRRSTQIESEKSVVVKKQPALTSRRGKDFPREEYKKAEKDYMQGRYEDAAGIIDQLVDSHPNDPTIRLLCGHIYCYGLQRYDVAQEQYQSVLEITADAEFTNYANSGLSYARQCAMESENRER
jgi:Caspase domain